MCANNWARPVSWAWAALLMPAILFGCSSIGPPHVVRDRFDYSEAISRSWKQNMLLNLVKLRYADAPLFLNVASVVEQYTLQGQVPAAAQPNFNFNTGTTHATQWVLNDQPVIPIPLGDDWNLITRTVMPIVNQPELLCQHPTLTG